MGKNMQNHLGLEVSHVFGNNVNHVLRHLGSRDLMGNMSLKAFTNANCSSAVLYFNNSTTNPSASAITPLVPRKYFRNMFRICLDEYALPCLRVAPWRFSINPESQVVSTRQSKLLCFSFQNNHPLIVGTCYVASVWRGFHN